MCGVNGREPRQHSTPAELTVLRTHSRHDRLVPDRHRCSERPDAIDLADFCSAELRIDRTELHAPRVREVGVRRAEVETTLR